jgi:hypothetical protein
VQTISCCYENNCLPSRYNVNASVRCLGNYSSIPAFRHCITIFMKLERRPQYVFMGFVSFSERKMVRFLHIAAIVLVTVIPWVCLQGGMECSPIRRAFAFVCFQFIHDILHSHASALLKTWRMRSGLCTKCSNRVPCVPQPLYSTTTLVRRDQNLAMSPQKLTAFLIETNDRICCYEYYVGY